MRPFKYWCAPVRPLSWLPRYIGRYAPAEKLDCTFIPWCCSAAEHIKRRPNWKWHNGDGWTASQRVQELHPIILSRTMHLQDQSHRAFPWWSDHSSGPPAFGRVLRKVSLVLYDGKSAFGLSPKLEQNAWRRSLVYEELEEVTMPNPAEYVGSAKNWGLLFVPIDSPAWTFLVQTCNPLLLVSRQVCAIWVGSRLNSAELLAGLLIKDPGLDGLKPYAEHFHLSCVSLRCQLRHPGEERGLVDWPDSAHPIHREQGMAADSGLPLLRNPSLTNSIFQ